MTWTPEQQKEIDELKKVNSDAKTGLVDLIDAYWLDYGNPKVYGSKTFKTLRFIVKAAFSPQLVALSAGVVGVISLLLLIEANENTAAQTKLLAHETERQRRIEEARIIWPADGERGVYPASLRETVLSNYMKAERQRNPNLLDWDQPNVVRRLDISGMTMDCQGWGSVEFKGVIVNEDAFFERCGAQYLLFSKNHDTQVVPLELKNRFTYLSIDFVSEENVVDFYEVNVPNVAVSGQVETKDNVEISMSVDYLDMEINRSRTGLLTLLANDLELGIHDSQILGIAVFPTFLYPSIDATSVASGNLEKAVFEDGDLVSISLSNVEVGVIRPRHTFYVDIKFKDTLVCPHLFVDVNPQSNSNDLLSMHADNPCLHVEDARYEYDPDEDNTQPQTDHYKEWLVVNGEDFVERITRFKSCDSWSASSKEISKYNALDRFCEALQKNALLETAGEIVDELLEPNNK